MQIRNESAVRHPHSQDPADAMTEVVKMTASLCVEDLCTIFKLNRRAIYNLVATHGLPCFRISRKLRFRLDEVLLWAEELRVPNNPEVLRRGKKTQRHRQVGSQPVSGWKTDQANLSNTVQERSPAVRKATSAGVSRLIDVERILEETYSD